MKRALLVFVLAACVSPAARPPERRAAPQTVKCGAQTCAADEYCEIRCTCCGMRLPDPSEASATYACKKLPASCAAGSGSSSPDECARVVQVPCA